MGLIIVVKPRSIEPHNTEVKFTHPGDAWTFAADPQVGQAEDEAITPEE